MSLSPLPAGTASASASHAMPTAARRPSSDAAAPANAFDALVADLASDDDTPRRSTPAAISRQAVAAGRGTTDTPAAGQAGPDTASGSDASTKKTTADAAIDPEAWLADVLAGALSVQAKAAGTSDTKPSRAASASKDADARDDKSPADQPATAAWAAGLPPVLAAILLAAAAAATTSDPAASAAGSTDTTQPGAGDAPHGGTPPVPATTDTTAAALAAASLPAGAAADATAPANTPPQPAAARGAAPGVAMPDVARAALDAAIAATSAADAGSGAAVAEAAAGAGTTSPAGRAAGAAISPTLATALAAARAAHAAAVAANRAPASESTMPAGAAGIRNQGAAPQGAVPPQATAAAPGAMAQSIAAAVAAATRSTGGTPAGKTAGKSAESSSDRAGASAAGVSAAGASLLAAAAAHAGLLAGSAPGAAADVVVAGAPLDVPMPSPAEGTAEQIVQTLRLQAADGGGIAEIRLQPEQFGHLTISLHVTDGLVSARLQADSAAARDWLQANADALRHGLSTHDLTLDRLEIAEPPSTPSPSDRRGTGDRAFRDQPPPRRQPRRTPSGAGETFELIA